MNFSHPRQNTLFTLNFFLLFLIVYFSFFSTDLLIPVLPLYTIGLGGDELHVGLLAGLFYTCSIAFRPLLGRCANRYGLRPLLIFGAGLYSAAGLGLIFFPSLPALYLFRSAQGIGLGGFLLAYNTLSINIAPPSRKGESVGVLGVASMGSLATAPWLAEYLRGYGPGCRLFFGLTIAASLVSLVLSLIFSEPEIDREESAEVALPRFPGIALLPSAAIFFPSLPLGATLTFLPLMGLQRSLSSIGVFFTVFALASAIIRPLAGLLSDRWGRLTILVPGLAIEFISVLLIAKAASNAQLLLGGFLFSAGMGLIYPSLIALTADLLTPAERTTGIITFTMAYDLGQTTGSYLSGLMLLKLEYSGLYLLFAIVVLLPLILLPTLKQNAAHKRAASSNPPHEF